MGRLDGRPVLVTGAASGVGRSACARLVAEGATVAALDVSPAVSKVPDILPLVCDVGDEPAVASAVARAAAELGGLRGVATCAAIYDPADGKPAGDVSLGTFERVLSINLTGTFLTVKHALPHIAERGGSVVMVSSLAALQGVGRGTGYTASKGAITALTRLWAVQYGPGVRVNSIAPGGIRTPMAMGFWDDPRTQDAVERSVPLRRIAEPEEIAATIAYLLSDDSSYMTGATIVLDGGSSIA